MKPKLKRYFAFPNDIQIITGKGERYARSNYQKIKKHFKKLDHQPLSLEELSIYYGITLDKLNEILPN